MVADTDTAVRVGSVELKSPIMTASGTAGSGDELAAYFDLASIGAIVTKSIAAYEWPGNPAPRIHATPLGMINAVGLQGPGIGAWLDHHLPALEQHGATVVCSIWGRTVDDYRQAAEMPGPCRPTALIIPSGVAWTRGARWPGHSKIAIDLVTTPPIDERSK